MPKQTQTQVKTISVIIIITLIGRVMGLGRDMLMGQTFGAGHLADALTVASHLPRIFFDAIFAAAISASFIPVFNEVMEQRGQEEAFRLSSSFLTIVGLAAAGLTVLGVVFAEPLITLMANFDPQTANLAANLLRTIFPSLFFTGIAFSMVGILNSFGRFNVPAAMPIASNGILIVYFVFFVDRFGVYGAAVALLLGWSAQALIQLPSLRRTGFRYRPRLRHPDLGKIFRLMLPVMVSTWIQPINLLISIRFASAIPGGASGMNWANSLYIMIAGIFVLSVTNVIFPEMSRLSATGSKTEFADMVRRSAASLIFLLLPMTIGLMLLATPLIQLLYEYRQFDKASTTITASALFFMSLGMVGYGIQNVLIRVFFAEKNGKIPLLSGVISIAINLLLSRLLVGEMGVAGLALAMAVSLTLSTIALVIPAHRLFERTLITKPLTWGFCKMLLAALCMGVVVLLLRNGLLNVLEPGMLTRFLLVGVPTAAGVFVYLVLTYLFRVDEAKTAFGIVKKLRKRSVAG